jgi:TRAP-type mannitol/chloroaromatic compound transport system permease small subunit
MMIVMAVVVMMVTMVTVAASAHVRIPIIRTGRVDLYRRVIEALYVILFFPFHSSILKPNFYLPLGQTQRMGYFNASTSS